jgi:hypothetical protein
MADRPEQDRRRAEIFGLLDERRRDPRHARDVALKIPGGADDTGMVAGVDKNVAGGSAGGDAKAAGRGFAAHVRRLVQRHADGRQDQECDGGGGEEQPGADHQIPCSQMASGA